MEKQIQHAIHPTRQQDYPEWYQQVVKASDMAETSPVRGCMVIKPWGYAVWENIRNILDKMFQTTGVKNAYFPVFIPVSFLEKEAQHVEGFAKECAVVTHHRLEKGPDGKLVPAGELAEPLVVRPTSETIIGDSFSKWVDSYRDLPILINQWANVVRWEMRTRIFLRTSEFLWQEGHTVHADKSEAEHRTRMMLDIYAQFAEDYLAMPVIKGYKTPMERFPGAIETMCIESMMQDRKALQAGTSHFLGQNFAKSSNIRFQTADEKESYAWTTSWGVSTRLIGGVVMTHSDDDGLILPPKIASSHVVLLPIFRKPDEQSAVMEYTRRLAKQLEDIVFHNTSIKVEIDTRDIGGARGWDWIKKGIPLRIEIGPRDIAEDSLFVGRRDKGHREKTTYKREHFLGQVTQILDDIQSTLFERALSLRHKHSVTIDNTKEFYQYFTPENEVKPEIHGGFAFSHWCGSDTCETKIKQDLRVTIRCIPFDGCVESGICICCGKPCKSIRAVFAKAY
jgi:prolyl-tRNA synthetase